MLQYGFPKEDLPGLGRRRVVLWHRRCRQIPPGCDPAGGNPIPGPLSPRRNTERAGRDSQRIPLHNTITLGIISFPHVNLLTALSDALTKVSLVGTATVNDHPTYQVRVQRDLPAEFDPVGMVAGLCKTDYFVDVTTGLLLKTLDMTHPEYTLAEDFAHEMEFDDYVSVKGISLPCLIREKIIGQTLWELRLTDISFNNGLSDLLSDLDFTVRQ